MTKTICLADGSIALIDDEDFSLVNDEKWHIRRSGSRLYAATKHIINGRPHVTYLHQVIAGPDVSVSFLNGNGLDCRKDNLIVKRRAPRRAPAEIGAIAEALVIADLARNGHDVFVPIAGHTPADLISVKGNNSPLRWQVKFRSIRNNSLNVSLLAIHPRKHGYLRKAYDLTMFDGFAVVTNNNTICYFPVSLIEPGKKSFSICLSPGVSENSRRAMSFSSPDIWHTNPSHFDRK